MLYEETPDIDYNLAHEPETAGSINRELNIARRIMEETGANLFLTGKAGTGKTTFLRNLKQRSLKRMVILAPTGVAAINAGGMTIHSFFQLPFSPYIPGQGFLNEEKRYNRFSKDKRRLIASLDMLVIDEISMVRPDTLDAIDSMLRRIRGNTLPFGGLQLLLIGDLRQLAPVVRPEEWTFLSPHYSSPYFFESKALKEAGYYTVELQTIYRQQDPEFISILNEIRDGEVSDRTLKSLNGKYIDGHEISGNAICLTTHNRISDQINTMHLAAIEEEVYSYKAVITGKFPESSYPAEETLNLKKGARVMFIKNDSGAERRYYNGLIGTVTGLTSKTVTVSPDDPHISPIDIGMTGWDNISYTIDEDTKKIQESVDGTFYQIPLRTAWAITIHKSQGLTFDNAVIDASLSFAPGQLYVALSRCRSLQGLHLKSRLSREAAIVDPTVNSFIEYASRTTPGEDKMALLRDEFFRRLLSDLFDFQPLNIAFADFARVIKQFVAPIHPHLFDRYKNGELFLSQKIVEVGNRFNSRYTTSRLDSDSTINSELFRQKISGGCSYFLDNLEKLCELLNATPMNLDNKAYQKQLDNVADILHFNMYVKKRLLEGIRREGFSIPALLRLKAEAALEASADTPKKKGKKSRKDLQDEVSEKVLKRQLKAEERARKRAEKEATRKPKGYSQRETLALFRSGKTIEEIAQQRSLALSTIASHLAEMIALGELQMEDILTDEQYRMLKEAESELALHKLPPTYTNMRDQLTGLIPLHLISLYTRTLSLPSPSSALTPAPSGSSGPI